MSVTINVSQVLRKWLSSWNWICDSLMFSFIDLWSFLKCKSHPDREVTTWKCKHVTYANTQQCSKKVHSNSQRIEYYLCKNIPQRKNLKKKNQKTKNTKKPISEFSLLKNNVKSTINSSASSRLNWSLIQSLFWYLKAKEIWWECMLDYFLHVFNWVTSFLKGFIIFHTCLQTSSANTKFCSDGLSVREKSGSYNSLAIIQ